MLFLNSFLKKISKCPFEKIDSKCTDKNCNKFHMEDNCYYNLFEVCKYGSKCSKSHVINRSANCFQNRKLNLSLIDNTTLVKLIRLSEQESIKICTKSDFEYCNGQCDSLHCCRYHMTGRKCNNNGKTCSHGHSFDKDAKTFAHNKKILESRNLFNVPEVDLRNYVHDAFYSLKIKCKKPFNLYFQLPEKSYKCTICNINKSTNKITNCSCLYCNICYAKLKTKSDLKCLNKSCIFSLVKK